MPSDFETLCQLLGKDPSSHPDVASIHGLACGLYSAGLRPDSSQLGQQIADYTSGPLPADDPALTDLFEKSLETLTDDPFEFTLCLPDDQHGLAIQAESLGAWCHGFLHGFAVAQQPLSEESRELVNDLAEISQLDSEALATNDFADTEECEANEVYYVELHEFVRMAVVSLFLDQPANRVTNPDTAHVRH